MSNDRPADRSRPGSGGESVGVSVGCWRGRWRRPTGRRPVTVGWTGSRDRPRGPQPSSWSRVLPVGSVIKKRRKRMAKKKHRKLLKRTRVQRRNKK